MNPWVGWGLAVLGIAAGYVGWGWRGVVLGLTVIVFWLLLQFSRSLRVLQRAGRAPVGYVDNAVMLHSKLKPGMTLLQVLTLTRSLGERVSTPSNGTKEAWRWKDSGGASLTLLLSQGRLLHWTLLREDQQQDA